MKIRQHTEDIVLHLSFGILFIAAAVLFEERIVADAAFYLSKVINGQSFHVEHQRYILALSQLLPLLFVKLHLPLKAILIAHSVGHVLFFYALFLICRYVLNDCIAGWWLLLCQTAGLLHGFFVPMFEMYYAAGLLVLLYSLRGSNASWRIALSTACLFLIMTSHLSAVLFSLWLLIMLRIERKLPLHLVISFAGVLLYIIVAKTLFISGYESGKMTSAIDAFRHNTYGIPYVMQALKFLIEFSPDVAILCIATLVLTAITDRVKFAVFLLSVMIILVAIHFQYYGFERSRYQEQVYFPLTVISCGSFLIFFARRGEAFKMLAISAAIIIFGMRFSLIYKEAAVFTKRAAWFRQCITECRKVNGSKCALDNAAYPTDVLDPNWSFPIETMFLSSYSETEVTVTVCMGSTLENEKVTSELDSSRYLFRLDEVLRDDDLNSNYFLLKHENYHIIHPQ